MDTHDGSLDLEVRLTVRGGEVVDKNELSLLDREVSG